ncbi:unnamed protein product [Mytilus edulis]|uniref:Uncharacterized protein n=1 Tax=Mytilus edulis TaxID=6550 RepID=A0A8S3TN90_MYTED|nr:unnamed protein product [Mytilus edulis]
MTRCIFSVINSRDEWDQFVDLNFYSGSIREILFWRQNIVSLKPVAILREISDFKVFTDASDGAAAGFVANSDYIMHKQWLKHEAIKSSTWRELKAIELSIDSFKHLLSNSLVSFFTDNQNAVGIIQKGSKVPELQTLALSIFSICVSFNISLHPEWIPREDNEKADALSRIVDIDDWGISFEFFNFIDRLWGLHTVDTTNTKKIFSTGFWSENEKVAHPELRLLLHNLPTTVTDARAKSTVDKYSGGFKRFAKWTEKYREITCILPCLIESAFYSIRWAHNLAGVKNPCDSDLISSIVESARRTLSRPIKKKEPVTPDIMIKLFARYNTSNSTLKDLRLLTICSLAYTGFLRFNELCNIKAKHISFCDGYIDIFVERAKQIVIEKATMFS